MTTSFTIAIIIGARNVESFFEESIVIDAVCPLLMRPGTEQYYRRGGFTAVAPSIIAGIESSSETFRRLGAWKQRIQQSSDHLIHVKTVEDILEAKASGKLGIIYHFQGTDPIEDDLNLVDVYSDLGVRMIQITYNVRNRVGDGCAERTDNGLSFFGLKLIERLNRCGVVVDCSHTGRRTTLEAIDASSAPVVISHANPVGVTDSPRNVTDEQIKAIAQSGGLIGANSFPPFVKRQGKPTIDEFIDHICYIGDLVGIDHVGLGLDYYYDQEPFVDGATAKASYDKWVSSGQWDTKTYNPPPWEMPEGLETPAGVVNLSDALLRRGFSHQDCRKVLGENWVRVFRAVWPSLK